MNGEQQNLSLAEAAIRFLSTLPAQERQESQQELNKFVRWYGGERIISELTIPEVANYAEGIGTSATNPMRKLETVKAFLTYAKKEGLIKTSLAPHLRVAKSASKRGLSAKRRLEGIISLTPEGYAEIETELAALKSERPRIADELYRAMADKDFGENAPLDAIREHQGQIEARIRSLEATLKAASVLNEVVAEKAELGSKVTLRYLESGEEICYTLVDPREANPIKGKLSIASPTGKALLNRAKGDVVEVAAPAGRLRYQIESIER